MMMKQILGLVLLFCLIGGSVLSQENAAPVEPAYRIVGYYSSWSIYGHQYFVTDIPAYQLTHINYAFFNISDDGACVLGDALADVQYRYAGDPDGETLYGNIRQLQQLKRDFPQVQVLMSIGGLTWSDKFSDVALTEESRRDFVVSCVALMMHYGFDGIDIDWEFPVVGGLTQDGRAEDKENFTLLLAEFRRQMDVQAAVAGRPYLLTIAAPAIESFYATMELGEIHFYLDWINLMAYGYSGSWSKITNHDSRLFVSPGDPDASLNRNTDAAVKTYLNAGVPRDKIVLGVPFYGRGWAGVPADEQHGLYQTFDSIPAGTLAVGFYDYADLISGRFAAYTRYWDDAAKSAWLYNPLAGITISYEDPQSLRARADYVRENKLGGMMIWELANDDAYHTLLTTVYFALNP